MRSVLLIPTILLISACTTCLKPDEVNIPVPIPVPTPDKPARPALPIIDLPADAPFDAESKALYLTIDKLQTYAESVERFLDAYIKSSNEIYEKNKSTILEYQSRLKMKK